MDGKAFWELFLDTGSPVAYLLYRRCCREEGYSYEEKMDHSPVYYGDLGGGGCIRL